MVNDTIICRDAMSWRLYGKTSLWLQCALIYNLGSNIFHGLYLFLRNQTRGVGRQVKQIGGINGVCIVYSINNELRIEQSSIHGMPEPGFIGADRLVSFGRKVVSGKRRPVYGNFVLHDFGVPHFEFVVIFRNYGVMAEAVIKLVNELCNWFERDFIVTYPPSPSVEPYHLDVPVIR